MRLYDNEAYRDTFMQGVYDLLEDDHTNERANAIIELFDSAPAVTTPNEPLTLGQLREMDGKPVYVVSAIGECPAWYIVDFEENELRNPWDSISLESWDEGYPYTAYRRPPDGEEARP